MQRNITKNDRLAVNFQYQDRNGTTANPFGYFDDVSGYGGNITLTWTRNIGTNAVSNAQVRFNRSRAQITPYFSTWATFPRNSAFRAPRPIHSTTGRRR